VEIPDVAHLVWLGPGSPDARWLDTVRMAFTRVEVWDDARLAADPLVSLALEGAWYKGARADGHWPAAKDPVRLAVLAAHGGVYVDWDIEWKKAPAAQAWWKDCTKKAFVGLEDANYVCNAVVGCARGFGPAAELLGIYHTLPYSRAAIAQGYGGPVLLTGNVKHHIDEWLVLTSDVFYPMHWHTRQLNVTPETVCIHYYDQSPTK